MILSDQFGQFIIHSVKFLKAVVAKVCAELIIFVNSTREESLQKLLLFKRNLCQNVV